MPRGSGRGSRRAARAASAPERVAEALQERHPGQEREPYALVREADLDALARRERVSLRPVRRGSGARRRRRSRSRSRPGGRGPSTSERAASECGATNVTQKPSRPQFITGPPADRLYAVEPAGVATTTPSQPTSPRATSLTHQRDVGHAAVQRARHDDVVDGEADALALADRAPPSAAATTLVGPRERGRSPPPRARRRSRSSGTRRGRS